MSKIDSISTLPKEIIGLAVNKSEQKPDKLKPSYLLKVFHRSLPQNNLVKYIDEFQIRSDGRKRGVTMELDTSLHVMTMPASTTYTEMGKSITINGIAFPGSSFGEEIFDGLDSLYDSIEWGDLEAGEIFFIAALFLSISSTAHAFIDGNGRVSVGLAKFIIDRFSGFILNFSDLEEHNGELVQNMNLASFNSLPDEENPILAIKKQNEEARIINISDYNNEEMPDFLKRYRDKLLSILEEYSDHNDINNQNLKKNIIALAKLLQRASS